MPLGRLAADPLNLAVHTQVSQSVLNDEQAAAQILLLTEPVTCSETSRGTQGTIVPRRRDAGKNRNRFDMDIQDKKGPFSDSYPVHPVYPC